MGKVKGLWEDKKTEICWALYNKKISPKQAVAQLMDIGFEEWDATEYVDGLLGDENAYGEDS